MTKEMKIEKMTKERLREKEKAETTTTTTRGSISSYFSPWGFFQNYKQM